jgi:large subunit ribosomal protein L9
MLRPLLVVTLFVLLTLSPPVTASNRSGRRASFVPAAAPLLTSSKAPTEAVSTGYGLYVTSKTERLAKKKSAAAAAPKKFQVKLSKHVAGTGQAGDVVLVTPAFYNNKLRPTKSAEIITDEAVKQEQAEAKEKEDALIAAATEVKAELENFCLVIQRKAGPEGQLFGGIGPKIIVEELSKQLPKKLWDEKCVKIIDLMDEQGTTIRGDLKHIGKFRGNISLTSNISGSLNISIEAEE